MFIAVQADSAADSTHNISDRVLLERRPPSGLWGGLLSFPEMASAAAAEAWCARRLGHVEDMRQLPQLKHQFTHFSLAITPLLARLKKVHSQINESDRYIWCTMSSSIDGVPAPVRQLIKQLSKP